MRCLFAVFIAFFALSNTAVWSQDSPQPAPGTGVTSLAPLTATGVAPDDVVISVVGVCDPQLLVEGSVKTPVGGVKAAENAGIGNAGTSGTPESASHSSDCKTDVTRAQFEKIIDAIDPGMRRSDRIRIAVRYAEGLVFAERGKDAGIDNDPRTQVAAKYARLQFLSMEFNKYLQAEVNQLPDADLKTYYDQHPEVFVQATFQRIFIPNTRKHSDAPPTPELVNQRVAADEAAMKALGEKIRVRALAGANFQKLEKEVYQAAGETPDKTPDVDLDDVTRREAPPELQQVFDMKVGQISDLIAEPKGWHIVKLVSKRQVPLKDAKSILLGIRYQDAITAAKNSAQMNYNDAYFNSPHGMESPPDKTSAQK